MSYFKHRRLLQDVNARSSSFLRLVVAMTVLVALALPASVALGSAPASFSSPPPLSLSTSAGGATGVTYTVNFAASATGTLVGGSGTITLAAPTGTVFPTYFFDFDSEYSSSTTPTRRAAAWLRPPPVMAVLPPTLCRATLSRRVTTSH